MVKSDTTLQAVTATQKALSASSIRLAEEAARWVSSQLVEERKAVEEAVLAALEDQHSVSSVARAYTISGAATPNRNAIYDIKKKYSDRISEFVGSYPFKWVPRTIETRDGERTVFDIQSDMNGFGPELVTGQFLWRYDRENGEAEPILDPSRNPYPTEVYYKTVLTKWLAQNPYPEEV